MTEAVGQARWAAWSVAALATLMCVACILWNLELHTRLGFAVLRQQYMALQLGLALAIAFLRYGPHGGVVARPNMVDLAVAAISLSVLLYAAWDFVWLLGEQFYRPWQITLIGAVVVLGVMEGTRRRAGWMLFAIVALFLVYALFADRVPGRLIGQELSPQRLVDYVGFDSSAVFSSPLAVGTITVLLFVFFGQLLFAAGGGAFFTDLAMAATGRTRGGSAKIAVVASAALVPAVLFYLGAFMQVDLIAARDKIAAPEDADLTVRKVLVRGWHFLIPFAVLLHALFGLRMDPEDAALLASIVIVVAGFLRGYDGARLTLATLGRVFVDTGTSMVDLILVVAAAGFVIGVLNVTGLGFALTLVLVDAVGSSLFLLLMISAVVCIILGMGMPTSGVYVLLASLVAPALVEAGVAPIAAHLFILYFGMMSMITPPVALAAFAAAAISKASAMRTGLAAMRIGWAAFILPFAFVATPALLFQGSLAEIALAATLTALGIGAVTVGIAGYWARSLGLVLRLAFAGLGALSLPLGFVDVAQGVHVAAAAVVVLLATALVVLAGRARANNQPI